MFLIFLFITILFPRNILAVDEFSLVQKTNYHINSQLKTQVKQSVELTNNFSEIYPKEYSISISGTDLEQISANDNLGNILQKVTKQDNLTILSLKLNQPKMGKNQTNSFEINYQANQLITQKGNTWEITLPQYLSSQQNTQSQIEINLPSSFGKLSFSSAQNIQVDYFTNHTLIKIDQHQNQKILLIFGNYQLFDFELSYYLENPSSETIHTEIALPPHTSNQSIIFRSLNPLPQNITLDTDGNWLAQYYIPANQTIQVQAIGQAKIFPQTISPMEIDPALYTKSQPFWPTTDPQIQALSQNLNTPQQIYNYVINTLSYDYDNLSNASRKGALLALQNPQNAVCTEFTDLFVTLARAKGIPAREIEGYAYTNNTKLKPINVNTDILHAWPQYYNSATKSWVSIDPTWEKTTNGIDYFHDLDLNHLTFVIHGLDSQYPPPPGSYKNNQVIKTVQVDFAKDELEFLYQPPQIKFFSQNPFNTNKIEIYNPNPNALTGLHLTSQQLDLDQIIPQIPAFSRIEIDISQIPLPKILLPSNQKIQFLVNYQNLPQSITLEEKYPSFLLYFLTLIAILIIILSIIGIIITNRQKK